MDPSLIVNQVRVYREFVIGCNREAVYSSITILTKASQVKLVFIKNLEFEAFL